MDSVWMDDTKPALKQNEVVGGGGNNPVIGLAARRSALLPKLCPPNARENFDSIDTDQNPVKSDIIFDFKYGDCGSFLQELSELYSYSELENFLGNQKCYERCAELLKIASWTTASENERSNFVHFMLQEMERVEVEQRLTSIRCFLYLLQGNFAECDTKEQVFRNICVNAFLLYRCGLWPSLCMLLRLELDADAKPPDPDAVVGRCIEDSLTIRLILASMYTMLEAIRRSEEIKEVFPEEASVVDQADCKASFIAELSLPLFGSESLLSDLLLEMITKYCSGAAPHYPMRKVLLLTWKVVLATCGGWSELRALKEQRRKEFGLSSCEDTIAVASTMQPVSVQIFRHITDGEDVTSDDAQDVGGATTVSAAESEVYEADNSSVVSVTSATGPEATKETNLTKKGLPWRPKIRQSDVYAFLESMRAKYFGFRLESASMITAGLPEPILECLAALQKHVYTSLGELQIEKEARLRKLFFTEKDELNLNMAAEPLYQTLLRLTPQLVIGLLKILLAAAPSSKGKTDVVNLMYEVLPRGVDDTPPSSANADSTDMLKLNVDISRQKEIISKAVSSLLLLLLKHFKLNHVYQFEYLGQNLVFANCIPLILKFFDQNILLYVRSENELSKLAFPNAVLHHGKYGRWPDALFFKPSANEEDDSKDEDRQEIASEMPDVTPQASQSPETSYFLWRNLSTAVNLLRIMNKLTKWKPARTMTLVVFKSAPILKRALKVKHAVLQLYALKLLKMQAKYLGRQWRKTNMEIMSAIYSRVRHRHVTLFANLICFNGLLTNPLIKLHHICTLVVEKALLIDDWAFGNETQAKPWEYQSDESTLMNEIEEFNNRRYKWGSRATGFSRSNFELESFSAKDFEPYDHNVISVLGTTVQFTDRYKRNYAKWLDNDVFKIAIDWDKLLNTDMIS
ncbi:unnamed protein product [Soboliphyme baturini]|uniref:Far11/STRP C-terminal domain-containing protein n=1 Tax=Soboliphyme baturini TaxID=241478 RepID=A0A183IGT0_9BILA|nr:unnamed protein product [Soboliphyme baturini]